MRIAIYANHLQGETGKVRVFAEIEGPETVSCKQEHAERIREEMYQETIEMMRACVADWDRIKESKDADISGVVAAVSSCGDDPRDRSDGRMREGLNHCYRDHVGDYFNATDFSFIALDTYETSIRRL